MEPVKRPKSYIAIKLNIFIKGKKEAIEKAKNDKPDLVLRINGSKLNQSLTVAAVC